MRRALGWVVDEEMLTLGVSSLKAVDGIVSVRKRREAGNMRLRDLLGNGMLDIGERTIRVRFI